MTNRQAYRCAPWLLALLPAALVACGGESPGPPAGEAPCQRVSTAALEMPPPVAVLAQRRANMAQAHGDGVLVLASGVSDPNPGDNGYRDDGDMYYLSGLDIPGSRLVLVMRAGRVDSATLYLPDASPGAATVPAAQVTGVSTVRCAGALGADLRRLLPSSGLTLYLPPENPAQLDTAVVAVRALAGVKTVSSYVISNVRPFKDTSEVTRLRAAADITSRSLVESLPLIRAGRTEGDVADAILARFSANGAPLASFPSIVAAGANALALHYSGRSGILQSGQLVEIDAGAEYGRYAGDVTRTFPVDGVFSARQKALYELVLATQQVAIDSIRPGITLGKLDSIARSYMRAHSGSLCGTRTCDSYFNSGVSHPLGLNVHDAWPRVLASGMVVTVEPGLYLPADLLGMRVEDDVLVTATGHEVLSGAAPRTVPDIERLLARGAAARLPRPAGRPARE